MKGKSLLPISVPDGPVLLLPHGDYYYFIMCPSRIFYAHVSKCVNVFSFLKNVTIYLCAV